MHFQEYLAQWIVVLSLASLSLYLLLTLSLFLSPSLFILSILSRPLFSLLRLSKSKKNIIMKRPCKLQLKLQNSFSSSSSFYLCMYIGRCNLILRFHYSLRVSLSLNLFLSLFPLPRSAEVLRGFGFVFGLSFCIVGSVVSASSAVPLFTPLPSCISRSASNLFAFSK